MTAPGGSPPHRIVLDTSAYSRMRAGSAEVLDRVAAAQTVHLPVIVLGELEAAFRIGKRTQENSVALNEFLAEPFVSVILVTPDVARRYGTIFAELWKVGTPVPVNDIWIAATTLDVGAHLLTFDGDFDRIAGLDHTVLTT